MARHQLIWQPLLLEIFNHKLRALLFVERLRQGSKESKQITRGERVLNLDKVQNLLC